MDLDRIPRIPIATLPTPVQELPRLSEALHRRILIKRDDLTGLALGGNKTRKLEFLAAAALAEKADTLITGGAPQSNHCRQTAAAAARLGLRCILVLAGEPRPADDGNLLLDTLLGAELVWASGQPRDKVMQFVVDKEQQAGHRPYLIPYGGSNTLGALSYALAVRELVDQNYRPDWILFPSSSGGTQAGLALGAHWFLPTTRIQGVSVDASSNDLTALAAALAEATAVSVGEQVHFPLDTIHVDDRFCAAGYGVMGAQELEAIQLFAQLEAILLDPVYTGRAAAGLLAMIRMGEIPESASILFWHTGGTPALWAYRHQLAPTHHGLSD
jgi:D-cysteine desulfhydrase family pyridoxal phosphate-dependent enzyme